MPPRLRPPEKLGLSLFASQPLKEKIARRMARLQKAAPKDFVWRELWDEARMAGSVIPKRDVPVETIYKHGRIIMRFEKATAYVRRVAYRAWKGRRLPETPREWAILRTRLGVMYAFLKR
jgi:hypothetical protein